VTFRIAPLPMTLNDLKIHSPVASLFECDFFVYSCAAVDTIHPAQSFVIAEILVAVVIEPKDCSRSPILACG